MGLTQSLFSCRCRGSRRRHLRHHRSLSQQLPISAAPHPRGSTSPTTSPGKKTRKEKFEAMLDCFPQEIMHDILLRLPAKSLIRCTLVCKKWRSLIINQSFIHLHHSRTAFHDYCKMELPMALKQGLVNRCFRVVGICNGLVCLADDYGSYGYHDVIWNPVIRKSVTLPEPGFKYGTFLPYDTTIGFGFDAMTADYKVVRVVAAYDDPQIPTIAEVYSLASGSWRSLGSTTPQCKLRGRESQTFVNGAIHWPVFRRTNGRRCYFILTFDVGSELFHEISLQESMSIEWSTELKLAVSGDGKSIALFTMNIRSNDSCLDIWVMKEYCVQESWTKLISLGPQGPKRLLPKALCFRNNGEVFLILLRATRYHHINERSEHDLVSLDLVSRQLKDIGISGTPICFVGSYEESLFLLDKTDAVSYRGKEQICCAVTSLV